MNKKLLVLILCMLLAIFMFASNVIFPKTVECFNAGSESIFASEIESNLTCKAGVVIEQNSKRVLLSKNMDEKLAMASTTKIMTALVAIENTKDLDEIFAVDNRAVGLEGTSIYLRKDEHLSMRHLLLGLMLASGNDASLAIGYRVGNGNIESFVEIMNQRFRIT